MPAAPPAGIAIHIDRKPSAPEIQALLRAAWGEGRTSDLDAVLGRSLAHLWAFDGDRLVGFVNVAWDGGKHASIFDTCVHPEWQRRGIGTALVRAAIDIAKDRGAAFLHVDYEPHLERFYAGCGFHPTAAGLVRLGQPASFSA